MRDDNWMVMLGKQIPHPMLSFIPSLVSDIEIELDSDKNSLTNKMHAQITDYILSLPHWFDEGRLSLVVYYTNRLQMINLDKICRMIAKHRPNLIF